MRDGSGDETDGIRGFVVGCERSGTTLLRAMLHAHPLVAVPPESYVTVPLLRHRAALEADGTIRVDAVCDVLAAARSFDEWGLDVDELRRAWATDPPGSVADAVRDLGHRWAAPRGASVVVDKTPFHVRTMDLLADAFPEARFVHLVRDGRDVADSLVRAPFGPDDLPAAIEHWRRSTERGLELGAALGDRCLLVRYERLVAEPATTVRAVLEHLELPWDPAVLDHRRAAHELLAPMGGAEHMAAVARPLGEAGRRWQDHLSPADQAYFVAVAGDLARRLDLPALDVDVDRSTRLRVRWHRARLGARRRLGAVRKRVGARVARRPVQAIARRAAD